jgi:hypothetical protein
MSCAKETLEHHLLLACNTDPMVALQDVIDSMHTIKPLRGTVGFQSGPKSSGTGLSDIVEEQ